MAALAISDHFVTITLVAMVRGIDWTLAVRSSVLYGTDDRDPVEGQAHFTHVSAISILVTHRRTYGSRKPGPHRARICLFQHILKLQFTGAL